MFVNDSVVKVEEPIIERALQILVSRWVNRVLVGSNNETHHSHHSYSIVNTNSGMEYFGRMSQKSGFGVNGLEKGMLH
jgi:hypothetical protein